MRNKCSRTETIHIIFIGLNKSIKKKNQNRNCEIDGLYDNEGSTNEIYKK